VTTHALEPEPLIYAEIDDGLVFITATRAQQLVELRDVIPEARTWADVRAGVTDEIWHELRERRDPYDIRRLGDSLEAEFEPEQVGWGDTWPEWPAQAMRKILPHDLLDRYGVLTDTLLDGTFLHIPTEREDELVSELERRGWSCERDDALVMEASGHD